MRGKRWVAALMILVMLTGCDRGAPGASVNISSNAATAGSNTTTPGMGNTSAASNATEPDTSTLAGAFPSIPPQTTLSANWVMPETVPDAWNAILPVYNTHLGMNAQTETGDAKYRYNTWQMPSAWAPYLLRNRPAVTQDGHLSYTKPILCVTLQGTVFLWTPSHTNGPAVADIPADATLVAEFVPPAKAVKSGIVPVWQGGELVGLDTPVNGAWADVLHMSSDELAQVLEPPSPDDFKTLRDNPLVFPFSTSDLKAVALNDKTKSAVLSALNATLQRSHIPPVPADSAQIQPASRSPHAELLKNRFGEQAVSYSVWVSEKGSPAQVVDYFLVNVQGQWLVWYHMP